jgi:hypothetical protein
MNNINLNILYFLNLNKKKNNSHNNLLIEKNYIIK